MNKFVKTLMVSMCCIAVLFFVGCEKVSILNQDDRSHINVRVRAITDDYDIQEEMQYIVDHMHIDIHELEYWQEGDSYLIDKDVLLPREDVQKLMNNSSTVQTRMHRRQSWFIDNGTYTVYLHSGVPSSWASPLSQACSVLNSLGMSISFSASTTTSTSIPGAIVISMDASIPYAAVASHARSDGDPGRKILLHPDATTIDAPTTSRKKWLLVHEIGHTIGFYHTDSSSGGPINSSTYTCVPFACDATDNSSVMRSYPSSPVPSWSSFSYCDEEVFTCIYGSV